MKLSNKQMRDMQRVIHLVGSVLLVMFIYSPIGTDPLFRELMQLVVVPTIAVSGIMMWKLPQIKKAFKSRFSSELRTNKSADLVRRKPLASGNLEVIK